MRFRLDFMIVSALSLVLLLAGPVMPAFAQKSVEDVFRQGIEDLLRGRSERKQEQQNDASRVPETREEITLSFAPLVRSVAPAVVNVYAVRKVRQVSPFAGDPFFERFFGGGNRQRSQNSLGSGVIVAKDGMVITNYHVIKDADEMKIALSDGREFPAEIVLKDEESDLAVLQIDSDEEFPTVELGNSDRAQVGDLVLAIGNPFGVGQTVTSGIISAVARSSKGIGDFGFFLQTDAAINPGNSGGALVDMKGRLIGINTAIFSRSGGSNGIGFAIPSNMVSVALESSRVGDTLNRPWIGASFQAVTPEIASAIGLKRPRGAMVTEVVSDGPADRAGIRAGDVILAINGRRIPHVNALGYLLTTVGIGNDAKIRVISRGNRSTKTLVLEAAPETIPANETLLPANSILGGATVANLSPALAQKIRVPGNKTGVIVLELKRRSPAAGMRIRPGDIIREINGTAIERVANLSRPLQQRTNRWQIVVERQGRELVLERRGRVFRQYLR